MRIARLPAENPRTQGPERRTFYRRQSPEHLRQVELLVRSALTAARHGGVPSRAVILGAGACTELPLDLIARELREVRLVDIDVAGMVRARDALPAALRSRVDLLQEDLTGGVSAALAAALKAQPWEDLAQLGANAALDAAAMCLERCPIAEPPVFPELSPAGYGLVISSLVLTQLFSLPLLDVVDVLDLHAPNAADLRETSPRYRAAVRDFRRRIALAHLALLAALLAPGGAVVFVTDRVGYLLPPRFGPHARDREEAFEMLPAEALAIPRDLEVVFGVAIPPRTWHWLVTAPGPDTPGRRYNVEGLVLVARS
jgi:hypothetical protein